MNKKIRVLCIPSDNGGCGYFRSISPHKKLDELYSDEFDVTIDYNPDCENLKYFDKFDIVHFHKWVIPNPPVQEKIMKYLKEKGVVSVMDLDDYWNLGVFHPANQTNIKYKIPEMIVANLKMVDYVTVTTPLFADEIKKINSNVVTIPNAIDPNEKQFIPKDVPSKRLRFGMALGSSHEHDVALLSGMVNKLPKDVLDKVQFVLCGFDLNGVTKEIDPRTNQIVERPINPYETVWYKYEKVLTDNYKTVSPEYKNFLHQFVPYAEYPNVENEPYRRFFTKPVTDYATHLNYFDISLVPIHESKFNQMKSCLKIVEAGMMGKAIIAQNYGPYTLDLVNAVEKGGIINPNGNALLVDSKVNHKAWAKNVELLVKNPELLQQLRTNLHETVKDKYNLNNVTKIRADFYKSIVENV